MFGQKILSIGFDLGKKLFKATAPDSITEAIQNYRKNAYFKQVELDKENGLPYWERRYVDESDTRHVRIGFVGAGSYAQHHLKVLSNLQNVEINSILTTGGPRVIDTARRYGIDNIFSDTDEFLSQDHLDCFVVVVPSHAIKDVAKQCLRTGKPVLMEKPAGYSSQETLELIEQAEAANTFGMVCMNRRFYSTIEHGLAALADFGPLRGANLEIPLEITRIQRKGRLTQAEIDGMMFQNAIHGIDLLRYILGDVSEVHSLARPNKEMKYASAVFSSILEHEGGAVSQVLGLWDTPNVWRLKIIAESGWLEYEPIEGYGVFALKRSARLPPEKTRIRLDPVDTEFRMGVYSQDKHFVNAVRQGNPPPLPGSTLYDAYKTNLLIEHILSDNLHNVPVRA